MGWFLQDLGEAFHLASVLVIALDADLLEIILLSLRVSGSAIVLSCLLGFPIGAMVAVSRFPGRSFIQIAINSMMGLPPVVVGLMVYLVLSNSGPLGYLQLLYTPAAMIVAQTLLITPIIAALSAQHIEDLHHEYEEQFKSMGVPVWIGVKAMLWDARLSLVTVALAGFGRAIAEVGAVMIVGGNIDHLTRVMTTAIALETSKGDLALALALGIVLMSIAVMVNATVMFTRLSANSKAFR